MNDPFSNSGFLVITGIESVDLTNDPVQGFTPIGGAAVLAAITFPATRGGTGYRGDATGAAAVTSPPPTHPAMAGIVGQSLLEGVFYAIPATALTLRSGQLIAWRD